MHSIRYAIVILTMVSHDHVSDTLKGESLPLSIYCDRVRSLSQRMLWWIVPCGTFDPTEANQPNA